MIWLVFALMVLVVLAVLLVPSLRPRAAAAGQSAWDLAVYRDQLAEVGRDLDRGVLDAGQADAARTEIQRRILAVAEAAPGLVSTRSARSRLVMLAIAIALGAAGGVVRPVCLAGLARTAGPALFGTRRPDCRRAGPDGRHQDDASIKLKAPASPRNFRRRPRLGHVGRRLAGAGPPGQSRQRLRKGAVEDEHQIR